MRRLGLVLACLVALSVPLVLGMGAALAASGNNCPGGAGDNQYVDPLGCPQTHTTHTSPPPTNSTPPPTTTPVTTPATVATTTTTPATTTTTKHDPSALPNTGIDVWAAVVVGLGLVGTGFAIRRSLRTDG